MSRLMNAAATVALALCCPSGQLPAGAADDRPPIHQTPDCLLVTHLHSEKGSVTSIGVRDTRLHLYVYVPAGVSGFTLGIFDQPDDIPGAKPSRFTLFGPDGREVRTLEGDSGTAKNAWADYPIRTDGRAGVWRLTVTGPEDREEGATGGAPAPAKAENAFRVRTVGPVVLYLRPETAAARVRGVRFGAPRFGSPPAHGLTMQVASGTDALRLNLLHPQGVSRDAISLVPADAQARSAFSLRRVGLEDDDRLAKGVAFSTLDLSGTDLRGVWSLTVPAMPGGVWGIGASPAAAARFVFPAEGDGSTLLPEPVPTEVRVTGARAARVTAVSARSAEPPVTAETDANGRTVLPLLPGLGPYTLTATGGFEYGKAAMAAVTPGKPARLALPRRLVPLPGWHGGDTHCHTTYYDGSDTPAQMADAARAEGLDWLFVTEHAHSTRLERTERAGAEARRAAEATGGLLLLPGMEYTGPSFHANVYGGFVRVAPGATLRQILDAARAADTSGAPVTAALNHPTIGKTAAGIARDTADTLPLMELWNSPEPEATQLWWDLLNAGHRPFAVTGSDSHHRLGAPLGYRRVYVFLDHGVPLTGANVLSALRAGRSFLSRGALLDFRLADARPGGTVRNGPVLPARIDVRSAHPLRRVEIIHNGQVVRTFSLNGKTQTVLSADLPNAPGWYLAQAWGADEKADFGPQPLALTNPIFVPGGTKP